jgi:hypothetical protein
LTLPAFGQSSSVLSWTSATTPEDAWGSQGNGGGDGWTILNQAINDPQTCLAGVDICVNGAHGAIHVANFGAGPFLIDDQGYVFPYPGETGLGASCVVRDFANGVH